MAGENDMRLLKTEQKRMAHRLIPLAICDSHRADLTSFTKGID